MQASGGNLNILLNSISKNVNEVKVRKVENTRRESFIEPVVQIGITTRKSSQMLLS